MQNQNILKNQWYVVLNNNKPYLYVNVKKDFYAEGVYAENNTLLVGYFDYYQSLNMCIFKNNKEKSDIQGISIRPEKDGDFNANGTITGINYNLYDVDCMDEYGYVHSSSISPNNENINIIHVTDEEIIKDINFKIRQSKKQLDDKRKESYNYVQRNRYGKLKEELSEIRASLIKDPYAGIHDFDGKLYWPEVLISTEAIEDWKRYLATLHNDFQDEIDVSKKKQRRRKRKNKKNIKNS